ncbi:Uma2 family endonuclease [Pseudanabaena sp. PCC 6802]|uniref:Uma2 family endonuclease n=1 Tax=Pseudanabaena sp. PCC 6802 TaxID=118173 RepID=UPI0021F19D83|nr:Uma2 family endonuclease [Pseudanabaena sp. PCC 6802]
MPYQLSRFSTFARVWRFRLWPTFHSAIEAIQYPCLIVEVLSPSTASYDRGDKFRLYRRNPRLQDYVLVDAEKIAIDLYCKNDRDRWEIFNYQAGDNIELQSVGLSFSIESVYEDIVFEKSV